MLCFTFTLPFNADSLAQVCDLGLDTYKHLILTAEANVLVSVLSRASTPHVSLLHTDVANWYIYLCVYTYTLQSYS